MLDEFAQCVFDKLASSKASKSPLLLDEFARCVFDKLASSKASKSPFLLDEFARRANSSLKLGTLLDSVNALLEMEELEDARERETSPI
jgi:hypothetical protein